MDDSRLLQESNLAVRQPQGATSVIQAITGEGLAQGPYVAVRGGVEPTTFRTEGTDNLHLTNHAPPLEPEIAFLSNGIIALYKNLIVYISNSLNAVLIYIRTQFNDKEVDQELLVKCPDTSISIYTPTLLLIE